MHRRREVDVARRAVELHRDAAVRVDARELLEEVDVEERAAEFAVGDALQARVFLQLDDVADGVVLDRAQRLGVDLARLKRARASCNSGGRRKLPTWSARNGILEPALAAMRAPSAQNG